jgi:hypothetical protein
MTHGVIRLLAVTFLVAFAVAVGAAGSSAPAAAAPNVPMQPTAEPVEGPIPCDPVLSRTIEPNIFKVGEETTVRSEFRYNCTGKTRKINYMIVLENSTALRAGAGDREALDNVTKGAARFVNQVDYNNDSKGGLILYASSLTVRLPLQGGDSGQEGMIRALGNISFESLGGGAVIGEAIRTGTELLPTNTETDATNIMIIIDAGGMELPNPLVTSGTACNAARQSGVTVAVISFPNAQRRLAGCSTRGWYKQVTSDEGRNVPAIFDQLAEGMLRGKQMQDTSYSDLLEDGFDLVSGSAYPRPPDTSWQSEYTWNFAKSVTTQRIEYKVKADPDLYLTGVTRKLSVNAGMQFTYVDSSSLSVAMPNPDICVYRADPSECANKIPTPTSSVPPPTVVPTTAVPTTAVPTDTPETPTPVPTTPVVPTDTPDVPTAVPTTPVVPTPAEGGRIFMPIGYRNGRAPGR